MYGWSEGAKVALVMAINYPDLIDELILQGVITFPTEINTRNILLTKNINNWGRHTIDNYLRSYRDEIEIQELWKKQMTFISNFQFYFPKGITNNKFDSMRCRTLIIHGDRVWAIGIIILKFNIYFVLF